MNKRERLVHLLFHGLQAFAIAGILFGVIMLVMEVSWWRSGIPWRKTLPGIFGAVGMSLSFLMILRSARQRQAGVSRLFGTRPDALGFYREPKGS